MTERNEQANSLTTITSQRGAKYDIIEHKLTKIAPNPETAMLTLKILKLVDSPTESIVSNIRLLASQSPTNEQGTATKKPNPREK